MSRIVTVIAGPTAVGKTKYAIEVAKAFDGEIVSCDSMQLYKYMDIGSAKPTKEELSQVKHHLVDVIDPAKAFSVASYQKLAKEAIESIFSQNKNPIVSGGTGLYVNSLLYDMDFSNTSQNLDLRKSLEEEHERFGPEFLHKKLEALDPEAALRIHPNNVKKIIRAIEGAYSGGKIKDFKSCTEKCKDYEVNLIILTRNREELYDRINKRVDTLVALGLFEEVQSLLDRGLSEGDISMKGIGYKEIIGHLNGQYGKEDAIELIKKNTRHFAKRQITWFKRYEDAKWFDISNYPDEDIAIEEMLKWLKKRYEFTTKVTNQTT